MARSTIAICAAWAARRCGSARASFIRRSQSIGSPPSSLSSSATAWASLTMTRRSASRAGSPGASCTMRSRNAATRSGSAPNSAASLDGK